MRNRRRTDAPVPASIRTAAAANKGDIQLKEAWHHLLSEEGPSADAETTNARILPRTVRNCASGLAGRGGGCLKIVRIKYGTLAR